MLILAIILYKQNSSCKTTHNKVNVNTEKEYEKRSTDKVFAE
jgi:hypothetical protein